MKPSTLIPPVTFPHQQTNPILSIRPDIELPLEPKHQEFPIEQTKKFELEKKTQDTKK
jgi:hypothetical protein